MADELMTTQELQELLRVDRTTVYAMLKSGRLPGFKLGGQWRFSRREVERWLLEQKEEEGDENLPIKPSPAVLPLDSVQSIQSIFAEAMGVSSVVTGLDGQPLTEVSNSCHFCDLVRNSPSGRQQCVDSWRTLAGQKERRPRLFACHAGLLYARGRIEVEDEFVAMIFAGEFVLDGDLEVVKARMEATAEAAGLDRIALEEALKSVRSLTPERADRLMALLARAGEALSAIGRDRLVLLRKLWRIAEVSTL
jgi:excisionase family DNA binding protein